MRRRDPLQTFGLASGSFASADSAKSSLDGTLNHRLRRTEFRPSVDDADKYGADAVWCNVMTIGRMYGEGLQRFLRKNDVRPLGGGGVIALRQMLRGRPGHKAMWRHVR
jgi:hypothetical protein